eukprot:TRINITY_DN54135_c0_g1_i1.p1 TRINITY_DN54135_c0_g1~~TRINITY_DN54135_c0_g1_i1.p1  ORF type:complete len:339 (-),score=45.40 TRINITY_DN54135_c0_g1_i1:392-1408(-)
MNNGAGMNKVVGRKFRVGARLRSCPNGSVYRGCNVETGADVAIKFEPLTRSSLTLLNAAKMCKMLEGLDGFPAVHWYGVEDEYCVAVFDLLGPSLEDLFSCCNHKFSLNTILLLADQMITCIEHVHRKNFVHRCIKPAHFVIGRDSRINDVYLIDFGLAKTYRNCKSQAHIPLGEDSTTIDNFAFMSINAHHGLDHGRKDDLESLGYILAYFMSAHLPWQNMKSQSMTQRVLMAKMFTPLQEFCKHAPQEFVECCAYIGSLQFDEGPDYQYMRGLFKRALMREGWDLCDSPFDWTAKAVNRGKRTKPPLSTRASEDASTAASDRASSAEGSEHMESER